MAHVEKVKRNGVVGLAIHCERREGCELSNKDIDKTRTHLNYNLAQTLQPLRPESFIKKRINEVKHINRSDIVYMADWIITVPKDVPKEDYQKFFEFVFQFLKEKYGEQNVVSAWVHNDEATPHIHFSFIPIIIDNGIEKLNCKKVLTKTALRQFHPDLSAYLQQHLGYMPSIQNGATINGNRTIKELKNQEDLSFQKSMRNITDNIQASQNIIKESDQINFESTSFIEKTKSLKKSHIVIDELKNNNKELQSNNISLMKLVNIQKKELDMYREMPLAKQLKKKDQQIENLYSSIDHLEHTINDCEYDNHILKDHNIQLNKKIDKMQNELFIHQSFISIFNLNDIFHTFKRIFNKNDHAIDIYSLKDMCQKITKKISKLFDKLTDRIDFLNKHNISNENIIPTQRQKHYKDMEL